MYTPLNKPIQFVLDMDKRNNAQVKRTIFPMLGQIKYDGVMGYGIIHQSSPSCGEIYSRTGKRYTSLNHVSERLKKLSTYTSPNVVLMFEVFEEGSSLATISGRTRDTKKQYKEAMAMVFDCVPYDDFVSGKCDMSFSQRILLAKDVLKSEVGSCIHLVEAMGIYNEDEARSKASELISEGHEGLVLRKLQGVWQAGKRNEDILKIKNKLEFDLEVVGIEKGRPDSKYADTLGKIVVRFRSGGRSDGDIINIPISGMTDTQRHEWWDNPDLIVGRIVEVHAFDYSEHGSLQQPRFKCIRDDKSEAEF